MNCFISNKAKNSLKYTLSERPFIVLVENNFNDVLFYTGLYTRS